MAEAQVSGPLLVCDRPSFVGHPRELGKIEANGSLVILVGDWSPLFALVAGQLRLGSGKLELAGASAEDAAATGKVGLMLADTPLPHNQKLADVLTDSARLLGLARREAAQHAQHKAAELGLGERLSRRIDALSPAERRAVAIAMAVLGDPPVVCLDGPFNGLEPTGHAYIASLLRRALSGRRALVSVASVPGSVEQDAYTQSADELLVLGTLGLVARGAHSELLASGSGYRVVVARQADALLTRLELAGYQVKLVTARAVTALLVSDASRAGTPGIIEAALAADAPILELVPLDLGLAGR
jgi:ABC-type multidrug transport system ATPase subunit